MIKEISGSRLVDLIGGGIKNLENHKKILNELNVFPVPDGDTGTNMVMTLRYGIEAVRNMIEPTVSEVASAFATSAVFGARGNSGVIVSQFFKGIAKGLEGKENASAKDFSFAFVKGCESAYKSVLKPVEGTMLTVIKDSAAAMASAMPIEDISDAIKVFLDEARLSLARTPSLLPILKKAGVVDSGASGIVYFFEGFYKQLIGEEIEEEEPEIKAEIIDLSRFNTKTKFEWGYCTEGLLQLAIEPEKFNLSEFREELGRVGKSVVVTLEGDKVKLHVHTHDLGALMKICQSKGEFLTVKIENMTVQNIGLSKEEHKPEKFLVAEPSEDCEFAVVCVATTERVQKMFSEMGADVVILSDIAPSSQDFMDAFARVKSKDIIVFPNSSNSILTSMQASGLYKEARVTVLNSRSVSDCYAALSTMSFGSSVPEAIDMAKDAIAEVHSVGVYHAEKDTKFGEREIRRNNFFSLCDKNIVSVGKSLEEVTLDTVKSVLENSSYSIITIFVGKDMAEEYIDHLKNKISETSDEIEIAEVYTDDAGYSLLLSFS